MVLKNNTVAISSTTKAAFWFTICNVLQRGIQFLTTPIYTRILSTEAYGMYSVFNAWLNIVTIIAPLSLANTPFYNGLLKYKNNKDQYTSALQTLGSFSTIVFAGIFTFLYPLISDFLGLPYKIAILMFLVAFVNPAFLFWSQRQRLNYKYKALVFATVLSSLLTPIIGLFLVLKLGMGYEGVILGYVSGNVLVSAVFYIRNIWKGRVLYSKEYWQYALTLSIPYIPHYLSQIVLGQSDRIMINIYRGASEAGIYSLAYQVSLVMNLLISGINNALTPWIYQSMADKEYSKIKKSSSELVILVAMFSVIAMLIAPEIVLILGGKEYLRAIWIMPPVIFSTCLTFMYGIWSTTSLFFFEKNKMVATASLLGAAINVLLNILLIPRFGFIIAAYTTLIGYITMAVLFWNFSNRVAKEHDYDIHDIFDEKTYKIVLFSLAGVSFVSLLLYQFPSFIRYIVLLIIVIVLFFQRDKLIHLIREI